MSSQNALKEGQQVNLAQLPKGVLSAPPATVRSLYGDRMLAEFKPPMDHAAANRLAGREVLVQWSVGQAVVLIQRASPRGFEGTIVSENQRRQFLRVPIRLPMRYQVVAEDQLDLVRQEIMSVDSRPEDLKIEAEQFWHSEDLAQLMNVQFAHMERFMKQIDEKLAYLIGLAEGQKPQASPMRSAMLIDLSGAGAAFEAKESLAPGATLKVAIELRRVPIFEMKALGTVTRSAKSDDGQAWEIGLRFDVLHEDDRERIFRFISRVERQLLRERREALEE